MGEIVMIKGIANLPPTWFKDSFSSLGLACILYSGLSLFLSSSQKKKKKKNLKPHPQKPSGGKRTEKNIQDSIHSFELRRLPIWWEERKNEKHKYACQQVSH